MLKIPGEVAAVKRRVGLSPCVLYRRIVSSGVVTISKNLFWALVAALVVCSVGIYGIASESKSSCQSPGIPTSLSQLSCLTNKKTKSSSAPALLGYVVDDDFCRVAFGFSIGMAGSGYDLSEPKGTTIVRIQNGSYRCLKGRVQHWFGSCIFETYPGEAELQKIFGKRLRQYTRPSTEHDGWKTEAKGLVITEYRRRPNGELCILQSEVLAKPESTAGSEVVFSSAAIFRRDVLTRMAKQVRNLRKR